MLEVLFAVLILSGGLVLLVGTGSHSTEKMGYSIYRVTAVSLANRLVERFGGLPYDLLKSTFGAGSIDMKPYLENDPVLASPALRSAYGPMLQHFEITGSFRDVGAGEGEAGFLSFELKWIPPNLKGKHRRKSTLKTGKLVVNYSKFGVDVVCARADRKLFVRRGRSGVRTVVPEDPEELIDYTGSPDC